MATCGLGKAVWLLLLCCLVSISLLAADELTISEPPTTTTGQFDDETLTRIADTSSEIPGDVAEETSTIEDPLLETSGPQTNLPITLSSAVTLNTLEEATNQKLSTDEQEQSAGSPSTVPGSEETDEQPLTGHPRQSPSFMVFGTSDTTIQTADSGESLTGNIGSSTGWTDALTQTPELPETVENTEPAPPAESVSKSDQVAKGKSPVIKPAALEEQPGEGAYAGCRRLLSSSVTYIITTVCLVVTVVMH